MIRIGAQMRVPNWRLNHKRFLAATLRNPNVSRVPSEKGFLVPSMYLRLKQAPSLALYEHSHEENVSRIYLDEHYDADSEFSGQNKSLPDFGPTIPRSVPVLPVIATTLTPVFTKFIRIIEIHDPKMQKLILKNVAMKFPFAGLFVRKDDANPENVAKDPSEIYETGTFIHIQECVEMKNSLRLLVQGIRRIN